MAATFTNTSPPFVISVANTDGAGATHNYTTTRGLFVIDVIARKTAAAGGAGPGNEFTVGEAANVLTTIDLDAATMAADNTVVRASRAGTLVTANSDIAAGGTLRVVVTRIGVENVAFDADVLCIPN